MSPALVAELARIGVVIPKVIEDRTATGWKPSYKGEEPPF